MKTIKSSAVGWLAAVAVGAGVAIQAAEEQKQYREPLKQESALHTGKLGKMNKLLLQIEKQRLETAPAFDKQTWPNMADTAWVAEVYRFYGQPTYWDRPSERIQLEQQRTTESLEQRRERLENQRDVTPQDQGKSESDRTITQNIRRAIMGEGGAAPLSVNARNIKVITIDGVVTLRGTVNSKAEKDSIEARAKQATGVVRVDNQLEVKNNP